MANEYIVKSFLEAQDRFEVTIHFPQGARRVEKSGGKSSKVEIVFEVQINYNPSATNTSENWEPLDIFIVSGIYKDGFTISKTYTSYPTEGVNTESLKINCYTPNVPFAVRVRRVSTQYHQSAYPTEYAEFEESSEGKNFTYYYSSILQSITGYKNRTPISSLLEDKIKLAKTALSIRATNQLNGSVDGINGLVQTYCLDYAAGEDYVNDVFTYEGMPTNPGAPPARINWVYTTTNNPASLFLYVLTHPGNPQKIELSEVANKVNIKSLQYWHNYCNLERSIDGGTFKYAYNNVISDARSVLEILRDICAAGKASPSLVDGKWAVIIDEPKPIVQYFTPHNSWGFESTKALPKVPHGLKIKFNNESKNYNEDELTVYRDSYTVNTATLFESISLPGVTNEYQVRDLGKWHFAQIKLRPEIYSFSTDVEYLVCSRGDRVKVTHDVPMWGVGSGRIKSRYKDNSILLDDSIPSSCFYLDEQVYIDNTKDLSIRIRNSTGSANYWKAKTSFVAESYDIDTIYNENNVATTVIHLILTGQDYLFSLEDRLDITINSLIIDNKNFAAENVRIIHIELINTKTKVTISLDRHLGGENNTPLVTANVDIKLSSGYYNKIIIEDIETEERASISSSNCNIEDLFLFGELNKESADLIILSIEPISGTKNAKLTLVDYGGEDLFDNYKDSANIVFNSNITNTNYKMISSLGSAVPTIIENKITSDDSAVKLLSPGVYSYGIIIPFNSIDAPSSAEYVEASAYLAEATQLVAVATTRAHIKDGSVYIGNLDKGIKYLIRLRYFTKNGVAGNWTAPLVSHTVSGKLLKPENVTGLVAKSVETGIEITWNDCSNTDYKSTALKAILKNPLDTRTLVEKWNNSPAATEESFLIFNGKANKHFWNRPESGTYVIMALHGNTENYHSINITSVDVEYTNISLDMLRMELTNDSHQIPIDSDGLNPNLLLSNTNIFVFHGNTLVKYDEVGTAKGTFKIKELNPTNVTLKDLAIKPKINTEVGDDYAATEELDAVDPVESFASLEIIVEGTDYSGNPFTLTKIQKFVKVKNLVLCAIVSSTPVVYKDQPDNEKNGTFSKILVEGRRYSSGTNNELYGWLGITPYIHDVAQPEQFIFQKIDTTFATDDRSTKWVIKLYDYNSTTYNGSDITQPPPGTLVIDTEEISVVFEGEVYLVQIESSNGNIFRPGLSSTTILKARVFKNGLEVTDNLTYDRFKWKRVSGLPRPYPYDDDTWNAMYVSGYKQILVNIDDVHSRATFFCEILTT